MSDLRAGGDPTERRQSSQSSRRAEAGPEQVDALDVPRVIAGAPSDRIDEGMSASGLT